MAASYTQERVVLESGLVDAGPGLGVEALDLDVEGIEPILQRVHQRRILAGAQPGVAEHSRAERREVRVALGAHRLGRLAKEKELVLARHLHRETHRTRPLVDALEELARRNEERLARLRFEIEQEGGRPRLPRDDAEGGQVDGRADIGISGVPPGDGGVVVQLVRHVPPEDDVAEAEPSFGRAPELLQGQVLAAQDAVDVESADLHLAHAVLLELVAQGLDLRGARLLHRGPPGRQTWMCGRGASSARWDG